jgi:hypothetical protein
MGRIIPQPPFRLHSISQVVCILSFLTFLGGQSVTAVFAQNGALPQGTKPPVVPSPVDSQPSPSDAQRKEAEKKQSDKKVVTELEKPSNRADKATATKVNKTTVTQQAISSGEPSRLNESNLTKGSSDKARSMDKAQDQISRELKDIARNARLELDKNRLPKIEPARVALTSALGDLDKFLKTNPSASDSWNTFLRLDELRKELGAEKPNPAVLVDIETNMHQNYLGLEYEPYLKLRNALVEMVRALRYGANPEQTIKLLDGRLEKLIESLDEPVSDADTERSEVVGVVANYLHESGQAPKALAAMRSKFMQPNVQVYMREEMVNRLVQRPIAQPSPVTDCILGTSITGNAFLQGNLTADVMPQVGGVSVVLNMNANLSSNSVGLNRGVSIYSTSYSPVHASKYVSVLLPGAVMSSPATVATDLQSQIYSIQHRLRLVRRIASRKAQESQPLATAIAEDHMQARIRSQFDEQVESQLNDLRGRLTNFNAAPSRPELARIGMPKPSYFVHSTSNSVQAALTQGTEWQLAASRSNSLAKLPVSDGFAAVHQSAIMNSLDVFLAGRTIKSADLDDLVRQFGIPVSTEIAKEANGPIWTITFAPFHPIQIELDEKRVKITLRVIQMTRGDQSLKQPATVMATYRPSYENGHFRMDREGDLNIEFVGRASGGLSSVSLRAFLKSKFEDTFKPVLVDRYIDIPQLASNLPKLRLSSIQIDRGWLQLGIK